MVDNGKPSFLAVYMILSARKLMPSVLLRFGMETIRSWMLRTDWEYPQPWNQPVVYATSIKNHQKPLQIPSFWFETQAYLSKLLDICQLGIVSLSFTWKVHDAWLANGSKWSPGAGGNWLMIPQHFPISWAGWWMGIPMVAYDHPQYIRYNTGYIIHHH